MNRYPILCKENQCTACAVCQQVCLHTAIEMAPNDKGFLYPHVDEKKCVQCLLCEAKCPILKSKRKVNNKPKIYACWNKDEQVRQLSSSGGAFSTIAEYILSQNGYVWGAAYSKDLKLTYQYVCISEDLDKLRRSKYIQCEVGNAFQEIKKQLSENKKVLFVGTSCHIRGLYSFIPQRIANNLTTVDFICHGVPSPAVFRKYINWLEKKYNDKLMDFNFRDKRYGWDNGVLTVGKFQKAGEKKFMDSENSFFYGMLHDLFIRPCCHECTSNGLQREADFTIADFWGIGRKNKFSQEKEKTKGISLLALNSDKAHTIFSNYLSEKLVYQLRTLEEAYNGNWNYRYSAKRNPKTPIFWNEFYITDDWKTLLHFFQPTFSERCKLFVKRYMGPVVANKLRKMLNK